jgi:hypothetical protein
MLAIRLIALIALLRRSNPRAGIVGVRNAWLSLQGRRPRARKTTLLILSTLGELIIHIILVKENLVLSEAGGGKMTRVRIGAGKAVGLTKRRLGASKDMKAVGTWTMAGAVEAVGEEGEEEEGEEETNGVELQDGNRIKKVRQDGIKTRAGQVGVMIRTPRNEVKKRMDRVGPRIMAIRIGTRILTGKKTKAQDGVNNKLGIPGELPLILAVEVGTKLGITTGGKNRFRVLKLLLEPEMLCLLSKSRRSTTPS